MVLVEQGESREARTGLPPPSPFFPSTIKELTWLRHAHGHLIQCYTALYEKSLLYQDLKITIKKYSRGYVELAWVAFCVGWRKTGTVIKGYSYSFRFKPLSETSFTFLEDSLPFQICH